MNKLQVKSVDNEFLIDLNAHAVISKRVEERVKGEK
jgi:hypothetical protein